MTVAGGGQQKGAGASNKRVGNCTASKVKSGQQMMEQALDDRVDRGCNNQPLMIVVKASSS